MQYRYLTKNILPFSSIVFKKARGVKLWDVNNKEYLDFSSQTLNLNLGNSHPLVKKAFLEQFEKFTFLSSRFINEVLYDLSEKICKVSPIQPCKINLKLTNGSDANESAFKRVRSFRKKPMIVAFKGTHAGETIETLAASDNLKLKPLIGSRNFIHIPSPFETSGEKDSLKILEKLFIQRNDIAGLILEPIMVSAGGFIFSKNSLKKIRELCSFYNISLIFDEIQTAFGWLGTIFASDYFDVKPDIITLGKGLGCGFPLAGVILKEEYDVLDYGEDEFTYGGHPISCSIALQNIKYLQKSNILSAVKSKSKLLANLLLEIKKKHKDVVKEIRVCGLIAAIEFFNNKFASLIYDTGLSNGIIVRKAINDSNFSLVFKPPIIVKNDEIKKALKIIDYCISKSQTQKKSY